MNAPESSLKGLEAVLDEGLMKLGQSEREALILRFFEGRTHQEVGKYLGVGEDAARKRTEKGLRELMRFFQRRGYSVPTAAAAASLLTGTAQGAPEGLSSTISKVAVAVASTPAPVKILLKLLSLVHYSRLLNTSAVCLLVAVPVLYEWRSVHNASQANAVLRGDLEDVLGKVALEESAVRSAQGRLSNMVDLGNRLRSEMRDATNLYAWNPNSKFVRLPKSIFSELSIAAMDGKQMAPDPYYGMVDSSSLTRVHRPFFDAVGSPLEPLLNAFGLTAVQSSAVTELCRNIFEAFHKLEEQYSYVTNDNSFHSELSGNSLWGRVYEEHSFVTPAFPHEGNALREQFKGALADIMGKERASIFMNRYGWTVATKLNDFGRSRKHISLIIDEHGRVFIGLEFKPYPIPGGYRRFQAGLWLPLPAAVKTYLEAWKASGRPLLLNND